MDRRVTPQVVLMMIEFFIPHADSLKSKRRVVRSFKDRVRAKFNASVAEIGFVEEWQRTVVGITMISNERQQLSKNVNAISRLLEDITDIELLNIETEWY